MREGGRTMRASVGSILLVLVSACGGDGNGPMDPGNGNGNDFNVSGTWTITSTLIENMCEGLIIPPVQTAEAVIQHNGSQISFIVEGLGAVTGTIDVETGEFEIDVSVSDPDLGTLRLQETGLFTSETSYTSEVTVTFEDEDIACFFRTMDTGTRTST